MQTASVLHRPWTILQVYEALKQGKQLICVHVTGSGYWYKCMMAPWKKVLGFKISVNEVNGTVQMSCEAVIETMYRTYLKGQLTYDAKLPMRDVELESGVVPPLGDPDRAPYLQMQISRYVGKVPSP